MRRVGLVVAIDTPDSKHQLHVSIIPQKGGRVQYRIEMVHHGPCEVGWGRCCLRKPESADHFPRLESEMDRLAPNSVIILTHLPDLCGVGEIDNAILFDGLGEIPEKQRNELIGYANHVISQREP